MSFFVRPGKGVKREKRSLKQDGKKKKVSHRLQEIDSDEADSGDDGLNSNLALHNVNVEEDLETAQEKKLRLAKLYLQEIERKEKLKEGVDTDQNYVTNYLKEELKEKLHKNRKFVADSYNHYNTSDIVTLRCKDHRFPLTCIVISSDNRYLFSGSKDSAIVKWSLDTNKKIISVKMYKTSGNEKKRLGLVLCLAISSDSKFLVSGGISKEINVWNPSNLEHLHTFVGHKNSVTGLAFQRNQHTLFSVSTDRCVKVWNLVEMTYVESLFGHQSGITSVDALILERALTASEDATIRLWKIVEETQLIYNAPSGVDSVKFINDDHFLSCGEDGSLCLWGNLKKKPLCIVSSAHGLNSSNQQPHWISSIATLFNTDLIASGSCSGVIKLWKCENKFRELKNILDIPVPGFVNSMAFTSDGNCLIAAIGSEHRLGRWWKVANVNNNILVIRFQKGNKTNGELYVDKITEL